MIKLKLTFLLLFIGAISYGQVDLINKVKDNQSDKAKEGFQFEIVKDVERTEIKNQGSSGTCWSYCSNSFMESEMARIGKNTVDLAEMYTVRNVYEEKADRYVRMHGHLNFGQGGALPDVIEMYKKYGAVPQSVYAGLNYGSDINRHGEMEGMLTAMLDVVIENKNRTLSPVWKDAMNAVLDTYLGATPKNFDYEGKSYTPQTFAKEVVGLDGNDYIQITSFTHHEFYKPMVIMVPDNWDYGISYNVQMNDMTDIIDNALKNGYSISWAADVSEKYFSWKNGVAYVPNKSYREMDAAERKAMFDGPKPEMEITQELRQKGYDNYTTTDDHGMQIVGLAKDQDGKEYYLVKNSWGTKNDHEGYLYVSKNYLKYKTLSFVLHKDAVPKNLRSKIGI
ncbi:MAG: bleomycin hydrolase [Paraglaciecola sp.]|jgi:bleomycin hydrolase